MERRSLDEILANVKTGRAISPAGIINAAKNLMYTPVRELTNEVFNDGEDPCWVGEYAKISGIGDVSRTYVESLMSIRKEFERGYVTSSLYMLLSALKMGGSKTVRMWMKISIEDVMKVAGLETYFDTWLKEDVRLWEENEGVAPNIGNLMEICFYSFGKECNEEQYVLPVGEQKEYLFKENHVTTPFIRYEEDVSLWMAGENVREHFCRNYTCLVCEWVWLLMHYAPLAILNKKCRN